MAPRRPPSGILQADILEDQGNRCLYCGLTFGDPLYRRGHGVELLGVHWDHRVPYAYLQANPGDNWAAACHVCNAYKADKIFPTLDSIRRHIIDRARRNHHDPMPLWDLDTPDLGVLPPFARDLTERASAAEWRARSAAGLRVRRYKAAVRAPVRPVRQREADVIEARAEEAISRRRRREPAPVDDSAGVSAWLWQHGERT